MEFKEIDIKKDRDIVTEFRRDSFAVSFEDASGFDK